MSFNLAQVDTETLTLSHIESGNYKFNIPSYQRPYVWPDDDVLKLFIDINEARKAGEENYFIGTVLTSIEKDDQGSNVYELIDGQQRTTTLMLIALAFKMAGQKSKIAEVASHKGQPRLQFAIRSQVQHLLGSLAGLGDYSFPGTEAIAKDPYLKRLYAALQVLLQKVNSLPSKDKIDLADYIFFKVQWVNNIVPAEMDLNRLFATMNTAGIQLEQADILKSKLFRKIKSKKLLYDAMWTACEHMENYFERNVRKVFPSAHWADVRPESLTEFNEGFFSKQEQGQDLAEGLTIGQLALEGDDFSSISPASDAVTEDDEIENETVYCRSIISFPLLLIHAYRIYLAFNGGQDIVSRVRADKLLEAFEPLTVASEEEVISFIKLLWQVRYQFDRWVVKWVERDDSDDEQLRLTSQSQSRSRGNVYITRSQKELSELVMLESVRNFTGERSAQYWLTPFIGGLIYQGVSKEEDALSLLEKIDNELSLADESETQKSASFKQTCGNHPNVERWRSRVEYFDEPKGTSFEHYWFQKLEYLLWKSTTNRDGTKFRGYRITAKNSIEHVHPQKEEHGNLLASSVLDAFGNLVLLSPGENSSYSNQAVKKKLVDFEAKRSYDSLKLKAMFDKLNEQGAWGKEQIEQHQAEMLSVFSSHYTSGN
ncbi:hypothetical protein Maes01_02776 [Microbulbifer aestuariivivens]|uniref:DUF262 domain-containing protein n=1 Tax=Microbulbifer aestuariivivens TaxID=1908308 RepID=A0ABP9WVY0_9GAMM